MLSKSRFDGVVLERLRERFAKPYVVGSTPTHASNLHSNSTSEMLLEPLYCMSSCMSLTHSDLIGIFLRTVLNQEKCKMIRQDSEL